MTRTRPPSVSVEEQENEIAQLKRQMQHWELRHHLLHKMLTSPTVAAAVIASAGTILTAWLTWQTTRLQRDLEHIKHRDALIVEVLKKEGNPAQLVHRLEELSEVIRQSKPARSN